MDIDQLMKSIDLPESTKDQMQQQVEEFVLLMDRIRAEAEVEEKYEYCQVLLDDAETLIEYTKGFLIYEDIEEILLFWVDRFGYPFHAEEEAGIYYLIYHTHKPRHSWAFAVDRKAYLNAMERIDKRKKKRPSAE